MQTQTALNPPITYNTGTVPQVPVDDAKVRLEATRYVACIGDFIEPGDKRQLASAGGWSGGLKVGASETEGAPTMWRSNYIINRACFTPLEVVATKAKADIDVTPSSRFPGVYQVGEDEFLRQIVPGRDMAHLNDDSFRVMGVVELTELADVDFGLGKAQALNRLFFPDLDKWLAGQEDFPILISDYETLINKAQVKSDSEAITQDQLLESARRFTIYANNQIEMNYQQIQRSRLVDMGGYGVRWSKRTKLFADQLGRTLEDDIASKVQEVASSDNADMIAVQRQANELKLRELELLEQRFKAEAKEAKK
jgi:hypothetical protein